MSILKTIKSKRNIKKFYDWQEEFFEKFPELNKSVIVNAPTGAGKTIIAEAYILKCLLSGKKAVYIAPLRSLSFEKYNEWKKIYRWNVHIEAGDFRKTNDDADVYIFTFEKFLLKVVSDRNFVENIGLIIIDEIHSLIEGDRGALLEFVISLVKDKVILGLSATVKNIVEVAKWLKCDVFSSLSKVIDVDVKIIHNKNIYDRNGNIIGSGNWLDVVVAKILENKRIIVFVNKRNDTKKLANMISKRLSEIDSNENIESDDISDIFGLPAHKRIAYHNGALDSKVRKLVEDGFRSGRIQCIVATKTLAMGINLPADVIMIKDIFYFENGKIEPMKVIDVWQMIGRAGRHTKSGEAYIVAGKKSNILKMVMDRYINPDFEEIKSKLIWAKHFKLILLYAIKYLGGTVVRDDIYQLFDDTFFKRFFVEGDVILRKFVDKYIDDLVLNGFIDENRVGEEVVYSLSYYGKLVCNFCVEPDIVNKFLINMDIFEKEVDYYNFIAWMVMEKIFGFVSVKRSDLNKYIGIMFDVKLALKLSGIEYGDDKELVKILKTISKLWNWVEGKDVEDMILIDLDSGLRYISLFKILVKKEGMNDLYKKLDNLYYMVKYGVGIELVEYVKQKGVGRKKALRYLRT